MLKGQFSEHERGIGSFLPPSWNKTTVEMILYEIQWLKQVSV